MVDDLSLDQATGRVVLDEAVRRDAGPVDRRPNSWERAVLTLRIRLT